jgi:mRNA-degrading endonuclease RelE of RelBE toxin-antitoxin system
MSYTIQFAKAAIEDLKYFTTRQQRQILDEDEINAIVQIQHVAEKKRDKVFIRGNEVNV